MLTGSVASSFHGKPRATFDLDIVIEPTRDQLEAFIGRLKDDYYISSAAAREALEERGMFNLVDYRTGIKVDFIVRKDRDFSPSRIRTENTRGSIGCRLLRRHCRRFDLEQT